MTDLDEIVLVTRMAYALRRMQSDLLQTEESTRRHFYLQYAGVDLIDYIPGLRERLDRKAIASENIRRRMEATNALSA